MSDDLLPALAAIPAGPFVMGSDDGPVEERPAHTVYLDEFAIGVHLVTNAEYARFVHETGYRAPVVDDLPLVVRAGGDERAREFRASGEAYAWKSAHPPGDRLDHPVTLVRWEDAAAYCRWLTTVLGRVARLPSEAEWEKAARGALNHKRYPWGDGLDPERANFLTDPARKAEAGTTASGRYPSNGYGLFDIAGNAWEWVHDWYEPTFYNTSPERNPCGPPTGHSRIVRGGGWLTAEPAMLTCSHRHEVPPDTYSYGIGFRVAAQPWPADPGTRDQGLGIQGSGIMRGI